MSAENIPQHILAGFAKLSAQDLGATLASAGTDEQAGIAITEVDDILPAKQEPVTDCFYAAAIEPQRAVRAHYHQHGHEYYLILQGVGQFALGAPDKTNVTAVAWLTRLLVTPESEPLAISEGQAHSLKNVGEQVLFFLFACPATHLSTDRIFVPDPG